MKCLNLLKYEICKQQKTLNTLKTLVMSERENLKQMKSTKGHFSVRNVTKRDALALKNRKLLREAQAVTLKQKTFIANIELTNKKLTEENEMLKHDLMKCESFEQSDSHAFEKQLKRKLLNNELYVDNLLTENQHLRKKLSQNITDRINAKKSVRYFKKNAKLFRSEIKNNDHLKTLKNTIREKDKEINYLNLQIETMKDELKQSYGTKNADGSFNDNVRLCCIELAGLEVAVEKVTPVIQVVSKHMYSREVCESDLPTSTTVQSILDEGHYLAKAYISTVIDAAESFGLNRDGTTRKKEKIVDTSVTIDTGDVMSLGFTRVAHETAKTINSVTKNNICELAQLNEICTNVNNGNSVEEFIRNTLNKLAFSMSDRASNEKLADKLLDEWRDEVLANCENEDKTTVKHFHCMYWFSQVFMQ